MSNNLIEIDTAMNMIKEEVIKDLSESVAKLNQENYYQSFSINGVSFSEKIKD